MQKALRETFYVIKNSEEFDKSKYNSQLQTKYGILKRTANSIITDAQGRLNALKELKVYEQKQLESKIQALAEYIQELEAEKADNYTLAYIKDKPISDCQRYKMIGNGWTVDVIAHILKNIKE